MTIHTISPLMRQRRTVEARLKNADAVLAEMEAGSSLHLQLTPSGPIWTLSNGKKVDDTVARLVVKSASVVCVDHGLFGADVGQKWRWWR